MATPVAVKSLGGQAATTQPAPAQETPAAPDIGGLVHKVLDAARTVRRDRERCWQLARQMLMVSDVFKKLHSLGVTGDPRVAIPLEELFEVLQQAHELVLSCQESNRCFAFTLGGRRRWAKQFRKVQEEMEEYLRLYPPMSHIALTRRLEHLISGHGKEKQKAPCATSFIHHEGSGCSVFEFCQLAAATCNFSPQNEIGRGGFGIVHKGQMQDGLWVAIKRCSPSGSNSDTEKLFQEFRNEVELLMQLRHNNIVKLVGYCIEQGERILVYEYIQNGSLDKFIYGIGRSQVLSWPARFQIIERIAKSIVYLHEQCGAPIVHGDIKANNILLDSDMNPKITDFGTARIIITGADEEHTDTGQGTIGYLPPEYFMERIYSTKSDVYSFGVVLIEIIAGKRHVPPVEGHSTYIHHYARELWTEGKSVELIDPRLSSDDVHKLRIIRYIQIGLLCVERNRNDRPSMRDVLLMLTCDSVGLRAPSTNDCTGEKLSDNSGASSEPASLEISSDVETVNR